MQDSDCLCVGLSCDITHNIAYGTLCDHPFYRMFFSAKLT